MRDGQSACVIFGTVDLHKAAPCCPGCTCAGGIQGAQKDAWTGAQFRGGLPSSELPNDPFERGCERQCGVTVCIAGPTTAHAGLEIDESSGTKKPLDLGDRCQP